MEHKVTQNGITLKITSNKDIKADYLYTLIYNSIFMRIYMSYNEELFNEKFDFDKASEKMSDISIETAPLKIIKAPGLSC